jgi:hypothetical protein
MDSESCLLATINMILSVTYYLDLHDLKIFKTIDVIFYQVKLLMFYNVRTINLTFVDKI